MLSKSNNWDSPADVLRSEHRQWKLQGRERTPRQYTKKDKSYWLDGIKEVRKKRRRVSHEQSTEDLVQVAETITNLDDMSVQELKEELKKYGVPVCQFGRKRKPGLLKMLKEAINNK